MSQNDADDKSTVATKMIATRCYELKAQGYRNHEIAEMLGLSRATISRAINSPTGKGMLKNAQKRIEQLVDDSIEVIEQAIHGAGSDMTNGFKAAVAVLKTMGLLKESVDLNHNFPKPTVIRRKDGSEVVLGAGQVNEDEETEL